ncbi:glycosyltransferase [Nonomuraea sp. NPDC050153]|uniref:glycosyltransferase n=1 Tax=Nonomuraea sp. NPDC050153 TaxID=3364359 RepID=UPI00378EF35D
MTRNVSTPVTDPPAGQDNTIGSAGYATDVTPAWGTGLPAWCNALISLLSSGDMWPECKESYEAQLAVAFEDWSRAAMEFAAAGGTARDLLKRGYLGPAAEEFYRRAEELLDEEKGIPALAGLAHSYALQHDTFARETQYAKLLINAGFYITVSSIAISAFAAAAGAGALSGVIGKFAVRLRAFMDKVFTWLERVAGARYAGQVAVKGAPKLAALAGRKAGKGLLARAAAGHLLRELPEEIGEGFLTDFVAQQEQMDRGTRTRWDGQKTASTILGDATGAVLASKVTGPMAGLVGRMPGISALNRAAGDAPGVLNAVMRFPGRAAQTALTNAVISTPAGMISNAVVYGRVELPTVQSLLGSAMAGVGRTNTISPFSVDVMSAIVNPRRALDAATTAALAADTARAAASPAATMDAPVQGRADAPSLPETGPAAHRSEPGGATRTPDRPEQAQQPARQPDRPRVAGAGDTTDHVATTDRRDTTSAAPAPDRSGAADHPELADHPETADPQGVGGGPQAVDHAEVRPVDGARADVQAGPQATPEQATEQAQTPPGGAPATGPAPSRPPQLSVAEPAAGGASLHDLLSGRDVAQTGHAATPQAPQGTSAAQVQTAPEGPIEDPGNRRPYRYETSGPDQWKLTEEDNDDPQGRAERLRERYTSRADDVLRDEQARQRERLWQEHRRRLAEAAPDERGPLRRQLAEEWGRLTQQHELDRAGLRVLAYCTEWDPHKGGIIAVNRKLVEALAEAGHDVYVRVGHEVPDGLGGERLHVIGPRSYDPGRSEMDQLEFDGEELPPEVDVVIGHSRYSGPAALRAREELYPDTPLVHMLHMVTGALGRIADMEALGRDFEGIERAIVSEADMLVGVGPVLASEARRLADTNPGDREPPVHELLPGVAFEAPRQRPFFGERTRTVLLIGRADAAQKGGHEAALMIRELQKDLDVRLVIRGAAPETVLEARERLSTVAGREVEVKPFTLDRQEMLADMRRADVVIMPSRGEGFGLVGLEAAGAAVPILVPRSSGVGALLGDSGRFPPELIRSSLVEQGFEDRVPVERWVAHLKEILRDVPRAQEKARQLQEVLREANSTWKGAAESLVAAVRGLEPGPATGTAALDLPPLSGDGWVNCAQGHAHWGRFGGAGLLAVHRGPDGVHVLMQQRGPSTHFGGTWSLPGGARDSHEAAPAAAIRETTEESDLSPDELDVEQVIRNDHGGWAFDTVIVSVPRRAPVHVNGEESLAMAWTPIDRVTELDLHPDFAAGWPRLRAAVEEGRPAPPAEAGPSYPAAARFGFADAPALALPAHPVTGARVTGRQPLPFGDGLLNRELVTLDDGTRTVYERYANAGDALVKVLDSHVGRAVGARMPLSYALGRRDVYTDHMPGEPASARHQDLTGQGRPATRDGVFLGLYHAVTAKHGFTPADLTLGPRGSLIGTGDGATSHLLLPDAANPFVQTFFRETEPRVFRWVDNPIPPGDIAIVRRQLDSLRPLFARMNRLPMYEGVLQRFAHVAEHARGTGRLLPRAADHGVTMPETRPPVHYPAPAPPGSPERAHAREAAEALLTGDGRFTDTSDAKTHAIDALARRMRSSTPELVLAAVGLHVGSDMINRLGDRDYVLVPFNERFPSIGAQVRHVGELDAADPRHAPGKVIRMDTPDAESLVRRIAVSELFAAWAHRNANSNARVLALQEVVQEEFGLTEAISWPMDGKTRSAVDMELLYNRDTLREFVRAQYETTQEELARRGIHEVIAYRGMAWPEGGHSAWDALRPGDMVEMRSRPLASWSADRKVVMDWLDSLDGRGVLLVDRKPAQDIISTPLTGMGFFGQREFVSLPGDRLVTLDHITARGPMEQVDPPAVLPGPASRQWRPAPVIAGDLDLTDPLSRRIDRVLNEGEPHPPWWPADDSGYRISKRDLDFLGITPMQIKWLVTRQAPLGMTPEQYHRYAGELLDALGRDGIGPSEVDLRLKGTGAELFAGLHKTFPGAETAAGNPEAARRLREWFGDDPIRPLRRPFDSMYRLRLEPQPSDYDMDISSTPMVRVARSHWAPDRYPGDFMGGHGYIDKQSLMESFPELATWKNDWEALLGRPISLGLFESSGPFDGTVTGSELSSHFRDTDWIIHNPDNPRAWLVDWPFTDEGGH